MSPRYLYVHVPFCLRRCSYCDFAVTPMRAPPTAAWLRAIGLERRAHERRADWSPEPWRTLYVGGGTPSLLGGRVMAELLRAIGGEAVLAPDVEWTAEANPESLTAGLAAEWRAAGVNRVSIGVQTFHEPTLRWMGRTHGAAGARAAVEAARRSGIENVSIDLIFGVPARLGRDWPADLEAALELEPAHVSLYGLTAEAATPLGEWVRQGRERLAGEERYAAEYRLAVERLGEAGYRPYEVSNFARAGRASRHNRAYWDGSAYLGLGPGAHSYLPPKRFWNRRDWFAYRQDVERSGLAVEEEEHVDADAAALERIWLGLRTDRGLGAAELSAEQLLLTRRWQEQGLAAAAAGRVCLTPDGWLLLDRLSVELSAAAAPAGSGAGGGAAGQSAAAAAAAT